MSAQFMDEYTDASLEQRVLDLQQAVSELKGTVITRAELKQAIMELLEDGKSGEDSYEF